MRLLAAGAAVLLFFAIDTGSLIGSDDSIYTRAAIESADAGMLADVKWMGHPLYEKGPVLFQAIQLSRLTGGPVEMQARLPGVLFGVLVLLLVYRIARDLGMTRVGALFASGFCLATNLFYFNARRPMTDVPGLMFALAGFRAMMVARNGVQSFVGGLLFGLSSLCKLTSPVPFAIAVLAARFLPGRIASDGDAGVAGADAGVGIGPGQWALLGAGGALLAFAPWHALMAVRHGSAFVSTYFGYHLFSRLGEAIVGQGAAETYIGWLVRRDLPAALILGTTAIVSIAGVVRRDRAALVAWILLAVALIPIAVSSTALPHYLVPAVPGAALIAGWGADRLFGLVRQRTALAGATVATLAACLAGAFVLSNVDDLTDPDYSHDSRALCDVMRDDRSASRIAGMLDLHDMAIPLYCGGEMKLYGSNPGFVAAVSGIPMLKPVFERLDAGDLRVFADTGETLVCEKHGRETLERMAAQAGMTLGVREFGSLFAITPSRPVAKPVSPR